MWLFILFMFIAVSIILSVVGITVYFVKRPTPQKSYDIVPPARPEHLEYRCISLPFRRKKFERMKKMLQKEDIDLKVFDGIYGKKLHIERYHSKFLTPSYKRHFEKNPKQKGHLGATFSHLGILQLITDEKLGRTVVFEDDCITHKGFKEQLLDCIRRVDLVDPEWDILQLGFSCAYNSYSKCHQNDNVKIQAGRIIKLGYAIGLFGYVVNGERGAQNLLKHVFPISWHIDHFYQTLNSQGKIKLYATIPNIVFHPGKVEISSFNEIYNTAYQSYISDTNL